MAGINSPLSILSSGVLQTGEAKWLWKEEDTSCEPVVLPAILYGLYSLEKKGRSLSPYLIVVLPALAEVLSGVGVNTFWYVWTAPAWFGFYVYTTRSGQELRETNEVPA